MDEYISGEEVARAIGDDREFLNSYILNELTPFHLKMPQTFEQSCLPCIHALENGQPDPFRCDTDPDPETYTDVVDGYSRHEDCGYGWSDDDTIIRRLKKNSFRKNEFEAFARDMGLDPALSANAGKLVHFGTPSELVEYKRKQGVHESHELARLVDEEFTGTARLTDIELGALLPAKGKEATKPEGCRSQGKRLREKYLTSE